MIQFMTDLDLCVDIVLLIILLFFKTLIIFQTHNYIMSKKFYLGQTFSWTPFHVFLYYIRLQWGKKRNLFHYYANKCLIAFIVSYISSFLTYWTMSHSDSSEHSFKKKSAVIVYFDYLIGTMIISDYYLAFFISDVLAAKDSISAQELMARGLLIYLMWKITC